MTAMSNEGYQMQAKRGRGEAIPNRDAVVLAGAIEAARQHGWAKMTREQVAEAAGVSVGTINSSFGTMADLRSEVMCAAIQQEILPVIAQGIAAGDFNAKNVTPALKARALAAL